MFIIYGEIVSDEIMKINFTVDRRKIMRLDLE